MPSAKKIFSPLLQELPSRQREVLAARFGIHGEKPQTLAAIGARYGITRERVRQIEAAGLRNLQSAIFSDRECKTLLTKATSFLKRKGGVAGEEEFVAHLNSAMRGASTGYALLLAKASRMFHYYRGDALVAPVYYLDKQSLRNATKFLAQLVKYMKKVKAGVLEGKFSVYLKEFAKQNRVDARLAAHYVGLSCRIRRNVFGDIGLVEWPEVHPKTVRDKIYLVLKKEGKPVHFEAIAQLINAARFDSRKALAPTVHNELIKDDRFVLVGRGIYALAEHGYTPGVAREVIARILKQHGPLRFPEIVKAVQKERFFKPNTVLANLQNKTLFERLKDGTYRVREA
ncbi:hypothetical protein D6833_09100 [Candidatus Parcubacteria bacterium]|nr:MAG: hypothetical protein D6833_09100 [Candidatus Parcubacteria bacterium]